ncbi:ammonium transporter [Phaeovulum vinaykumarii]|uniref:Ammonium transporter n=1 Tax=Phaeovulum vinaykumarii TaxID=407234 RepID=A0A1N7L8D9_9RHOB|nr:ammonium transporter [Phaeovulum vinaykumarii]SIS70104.1 ammonium transporter [Phaeovulum vinaykumarii]SOB99121.1 ammonium transporter [Phaeovulum vinaykumarii]
MRNRTLPILLAGLIALPVPALAEADRFTLQNNLDHVWTTVAAGLVFFMQAGFLLLEAGSVRAKNSINVAQKNMLDFILSTLAFGCVGFAMMFGDSLGGFVGWDSRLAFLNTEGEWNLTFFVFQLVFCGTAATIVSGAIAERMSILGYVLCTLLIGCLIYPVAGHWAWGGLLNGADAGFLAQMGFIDFAGSTVVHSVGGWVGLAAIMVIGARHGKFDENGRPVELHGHSPILATFGAMILWVGWIGFNGGSTTAGTPAFAHIIANTMVAGAFGGLAQFALGRLTEGYHKPEFMINGMLGGLVAITAGCDAVGPHSAALIGAAGGTVAYLARNALERRARLDDPLGAVAVHGVAGALGTILTGVFARDDALLAADRLTQVGVQALGVAIVFLWSFGLAFAVLKTVSVLMRGPDGRPGLRVPLEDEIEGLNIAEHHAPLGLDNVVRAMRKIVEDPRAEVADIPLDPGDESYEVGALFNQIMATIRDRNASERAQSVNVSQIGSFVECLSRVMGCYAQGDFAARIGSEDIPPEFADLARAIDDMAEKVQHMLSEIETSVGAMAQGDLSVRINGAESGVFAAIQTQINTSLADIAQVIEEIEQAVRQASAGDFDTQLPEEGRAGFLFQLCNGVNRINRIATFGLSDISQVVGRVAQGDLDARMRADHVGAFRKIAGDVNDMVDELSGIVADLSASTRIVGETADTILNQNDAVTAAARANQSMVTDLSARVRALVEKTSGNGSRVRDAQSRATSVRQAAEETRAISRETVARMSEAAQAVREINSSLDEIGDLAAQTHLLSINASVEAARAGDHGAGFAVVAGEVRGLAARSADTSREIERHVEAVETKVLDTSQGIGKTDSALDTILDSAVHTAELMDEISAVDAEVIRVMNKIAADLNSIESSALGNLRAAETSERMAHVLQDSAAEALAKLARFAGPAADNLATPPRAAASGG